jgi:hypothetical protein
MFVRFLLIKRRIFSKICKHKEKRFAIVACPGISAAAKWQLNGPVQICCLQIGGFSQLI